MDAAAPPIRAESAFRPDVEGLRGIAVLLVVLFHAGLPVPGGFIGVDVFFVISGFLITGLLLREFRASGRVSLSRFYARRIRRLLPAAVAVMVVTVPLAYVLAGPLDRPEVMTDAAAAALSVSNIRFALSAGDYFTSITQPSPFLHFWSLAVEEQFYLVWPALLFFVARGGRIRVPVVLLAVLAGSFVANVLLTQSSINWAFYSLPARAWQLAAGGLLAVGWPLLERIPWPVVSPVGWASLLGLCVAPLLISQALPYPGVAAVAPTLCAVLLIMSGTRRFGPGAALSLAPIRFLGRISYSLYLWHWPILVLPAIALGSVPGLEWRVALALGAVVVATASWRFVEQPFHEGRFAATAPRRVLALGLGTIGAVAILAGTLNVAGLRTIDAITLGAAQPLPLPTGLGLPASPSPTSAPATGPTAEPSATGSAEPSATPEPTPPPPTWDQIPDVNLAEPLPLLPGVRPSLARARNDVESVWRDNCGAQVPTIVPPDCVYGDPNGTFTVALIGDSHAAEWFPAFEVLAKENGWRLVPYLKLSCPFIDMAVNHLELKREYTECAAWREEVIKTVAIRPPDLVVVAMSHRGIFPVAAADGSLQRQGEAIGRAILRLPGRALIMVDTPRTNTDIPGCIAEQPSDVRPCAISRATAFTRYFGVRERVAAEVSGAGVIDLISRICPGMPCQVIRNGMIVYRDNHHLTATFSASLAPELMAALRPYVNELTGQARR